MKKRTLYIFISVIVAVIAFGIGLGLFLRPQKVSEDPTSTVQTLVDQTLAARKEELLRTPDATFGSEKEINILTLGIDSREEGHEQHCDAIHLVTLNLANWTIKITSVPRGTYSTLPPGQTYKPTDYYLANACAFGGLDYGVAQIQKITGVKPDYIATVGFSQALGIFRAIGLPTTETLQWLRHRQTYAIGDPQRSQNQATFMKDTALKLFANNGISTPLLYILYTFVDTNLSFDQVHSLYLAYLSSGIAEHPDRITFDMKPFYQTEIYHFDALNADEQIDALISALEGRLSPDDLSYKTLDEIQTSLVAYLNTALTSEEEIAHVYADQLWRQVEDESVREDMHYRFLERYVSEIKDTDHDAAVQAVTSYILEMQFFELVDWEAKGRDLMATLVVDE